MYILYFYDFMIFFFLAELCLRELEFSRMVPKITPKI